VPLQADAATGDKWTQWLGRHILHRNEHQGIALGPSYDGTDLSNAQLRVITTGVVQHGVVPGRSEVLLRRAQLLAYPSAAVESCLYWCARQDPHLAVCGHLQQSSDVSQV